MQEVNSALESLSLAIIHVLDRSKQLKGKDQYALINEFAEWIVDLPSYEDVIAFPDMTIIDREEGGDSLMQDAGIEMVSLFSLKQVAYRSRELCK